VSLCGVILKSNQFLQLFNWYFWTLDIPLSGGIPWNCSKGFALLFGGANMPGVCTTPEAANQNQYEMLLSKLENFILSCWALWLYHSFCFIFCTKFRSSHSSLHCQTATDPATYHFSKKLIWFHSFFTTFGPIFSWSMNLHLPKGNFKLLHTNRNFL
jgi:hypothetical protein